MNNSNKLFYFFVLSLIFSNNLQVKYVKYIFFIRIEFSNSYCCSRTSIVLPLLPKRTKEYHHESMTLALMTTSFSLSCARALSFPFLHNLSQLRKPRRRVHLAVASACLVCMFDFFYIHSIS